jgi:hypothetical protein
MFIVLYKGLEFYDVVLGLQLIFYLTAVLGQGFPRTGLIGKMLYLPTFLVNSNWAAMVGLVRYLTKRQTPLWQRAPRSQQDVALTQAVVEEKHQR